MSKLQIAAMCALSTALLPASGFADPGRSRAQEAPPPAIESVVQRENARRQEETSKAKEAIARGEKAMKEKDYAVAVVQFKWACDHLPESRATHSLRHKALNEFCDSSCALAKQRILEGHYADAGKLLNEVLDPQYDPRCHEAAVLLARLEDPEYYNKTITPKARENVEKVKQLFVDARGLYDTGRFDLAFKRCEEILNIDPYNIGARKMEEQIDLKKSQYANVAYNETRARQLWQVEGAWQQPVRRMGARVTTIPLAGPERETGTAEISKKMHNIIIPEIKLNDATIREAIDFLKTKSKALDPEKVGVNIVLQLEGAPGGGGAAPAVEAPPVGAPAPGGIPGLPEAAPGLPAAPAVAAASPAEARITLALSNIPLIEALKYITSLANLKFKIEPFAVSVVPAYVNVDVLITKEYKVPPGFIAAGPIGGAAAGPGGLGPAAPGAAPGAVGRPDASGAGANVAGRASAADFLKDRGVTFPTGASAVFIPSSSRLIVRNTQQNLDLVDAIVEASWQTLPSQVDIESKFVEINQNNLKELSFDWLLGQFNTPGSQKIFAGGGTSGTSPPVNSADFPFTIPGGGPVGGSPITAGNRSGNLAISANAIDALLMPSGLAGASQLAPGIFSLAGVFTDPQYQLVIRALNQKKGIDLLSAPRVTTKSGQKAVIEVIREFRYPTEFQPPQIPTQVTPSAAQAIGAATSLPSIPVTPTTPTAFETRNVGVILEVEPVVGSDGQTIDLNLAPQVTEFEGFINYGSPILAPPVVNALGGTALTNSQRVITDNVINQPIFSTRKIQTNVTIWDGQTIVIGGLIREDVQKSEDKLPLIGDLPLVGRFFRSNVEQRLKKNLIIFLTARLVNPGGEPVHPEEEQEEVVEMVPPPPGPAELPAPLFPQGLPQGRGFQK
jgi:type II secretory pathway component GspD/PulD (secretin)/tetratricopeptide (TPR) repeat protein